VIELGLVLKGLVAVGCFGGAYALLPKNYAVHVKRRLTRVLRECGISHSYHNKDGKKITHYPSIHYVYPESYGYRAVIHLPMGTHVGLIEKAKVAIETAMNCPIELLNDGSVVFMDLLMRPIPTGIKYNDDFADSFGSQRMFIPLGYGRKGIEGLDMSDDHNSHILGGGSHRTGKTNLIKMLITHLKAKYPNDVYIEFFSPRRADTEPFKGVEGIRIVEREDEPLEVIQDVRSLVIPQRDDIFTKHGVANIIEYNNLKSVKPMKHYFIIIDEYANYTESKDFVEAVKYISERGGFAGVHLFLFTQRPDANEVLNPRIKANMMTRIAFRTATSSNSRVILDVDSPDSSKLPRIKGRAIMFTDTFTEIQVPEITREQIEILLKPFRTETPQKEVVEDGLLEGEVQEPFDGLGDLESDVERSNSTTPFLSHEKSDKEHKRRFT
jgi:hypothetical protein